MIILEDVCTEITSGWYINFVIKEKKTIQIYRSLAICRDMFCSNWVTRKGQKDVLMQSVQINYCSYTERREEQDSSLYRGCKLLLSEDGFEVVRINYSVASIPPFRIDVPLSSESIQFGAKMTRMEPNDKVVLREILRLPHLSSGQHLGSRKVLKVFVINDNIDKIGWIFLLRSQKVELFFLIFLFLFLFSFRFIFIFLSLGLRVRISNDITQSHISHIR